MAYGSISFHVLYLFIRYSILDLTSPPKRDYLFYSNFVETKQNCLFLISIMQFWHFRSVLNSECINVIIFGIEPFHYIIQYKKLMKRAVRRCLKINILKTFFLSPVNQNNIGHLVFFLSSSSSSVY